MADSKKNFDKELIDNLDKDIDVVESTAVAPVKRDLPDALSCTKLDSVDASSENRNNRSMSAIETVAYAKAQSDLTAGVMDVNDTVKNIANVMTAAGALDGSDKSNAGFLKEMREIKQQELKLNLEKLREEERTRKIDANKQKAEALYNAVRPILEFDFEHLIPKADRKLSKLEADLDSEELEKKFKVAKTYQDRSYGIPLMIIMLIIYTIPYCAFSLVLALLNGINALCLAVARFSKIAMWICITLAGIGGVVGFVFLVIWILEKYFGLNILPN